ncbi:MAG: dockerin type I domain-containing protein [Ignavibacteria bacterium]
MGDLSSPDTTDVGLNQIYNNGNTGQIYDLYNNTPDSLKAENNYWGTSIQDSVEAHIYHKPDDPSLGNVDYLPLATVKLQLTAAIQGLNRSGGTMIRTDTITVYLREAFSPYSIIDSAKAKLDSVTYTANLNFKNAVSSNYYIDVKHFNSVETWSNAPLAFQMNSNVTTAYSFISSASQAYENNMILNNGKYCFYSGDINYDGYVDITDLIDIKNDASFFLTGNRLPTDVNGDGEVNLDDLLIVYNNSSAFVRLKSPLNH